MAGIYIHIPFCRQACHYCSFHFSTSLKNKEELIKAINGELADQRDYFKNELIESVYFGGGTPSLLNDQELSSIFSTLRLHFQLTPDAEVTLEANPEDIDKEKLSFWAELGVNRLSIGIQSFSDKDLAYMNRAHNSRQSYHALELCKASNINVITADLMFGLIENSVADWHSNLKMISNFQLDHLSLYNLTFEEQTVFANWKLKKKLSETPSKIQEEQFYLASSYLMEQGYLHYEISNYAKPGKEAVHNTNYWNRTPYLGIGPSAHSFNAGERSWNISNNSKYILQWKSGKFDRTYEVLDEKDRFNEIIMLGLRTQKGISLESLNFASDQTNEQFQKLVLPLIDNGILLQNDQYIKLSHCKWYLSDAIIADLFTTN